VFEYRLTTQSNREVWLITSPKGEWSCAGWVFHVMSFCLEKFPHLDKSEASFRRVFNRCDIPLITTEDHIGYSKKEKTGELIKEPSLTRSWLRMALDYAQSYVYCESIAMGKRQGLSYKDAEKLAIQNHKEFSQHLVGSDKLFTR